MPAAEAGAALSSVVVVCCLPQAEAAALILGRHRATLEKVMAASRPVRRVTAAEGGPVQPMGAPAVRTQYPAKRMRRPDPSPTAAQGHVAISGVQHREATAAAVAPDITAAAAAAGLPAAVATAAAIRL